MTKTDIYFCDPLRAGLDPETQSTTLVRCPRETELRGRCDLDNQNRDRGCPHAVLNMEQQIALRSLGSNIDTTNWWILNTDAVDKEVGLSLKTFPDIGLRVRAGRYSEHGFGKGSESKTD
jgi:hypothetical protein